MIVGRPDSLERDYGIRAEAGQTLELTIFDGSDSYQRSFTVGAVLDQRKIGGNSDKIDMLMLPVDPPLAQKPPGDSDILSSLPDPKPCAENFSNCL